MPAGRQPNPPSQSDLHGNRSQHTLVPPGIAARRRATNDGPLFILYTRASASKDAEALALRKALPLQDYRRGAETQR
jgi:hypothetical protein